MTSNNNTIISHTDKTSTSSKKEQFLSDLKNWREKYSDVLFSNDEIDSIFKRESGGDLSFSVRHQEDFAV